MNNSDRIPSFVFLIFSVFVCVESTTYGLGNLSQPGPGLLAFSSGAGTGILSLYILIQSLISKKTKNIVDNVQDQTKTKKFILICCTLFGYCFFVIWFGFVFSTFLFVIVILKIIESEKWGRSIVEAAIIAIGMYLLFQKLLGLSLPNGILI